MTTTRTAEPTRAPAPVAPAADPWIGRTLSDEFEIVERIGAGKQGAVYRALQRPFGRPVAVKILRGRAFASPRARACFLQEAQVLGLLTDASIVRMMRFGYAAAEADQPGGLYIVQELVEGRSLRQVLREEGPLDPERAVHIALQVLGALADAHRHGVVHRDLKPPHVLLTRDARGVERVKLIDFGLAHRVARAEAGEDPIPSGWVAGSPRYMAPEPLRGKPVGPTVDQYAVGAMLYEMLTGEPPFDGEINTVLRAQVTRPVPTLPLEVDPIGSLDRIVRRAMAKVPEARFLDVTEMATELEATLDDIGAESATLVAGVPAMVAEMLRAEAARRAAEAPATDAANPTPDAAGATPDAISAPPVERTSRLGRLAVGALFGLTVVLGSAATAAGLGLV